MKIKDFVAQVESSAEDFQTFETAEAGANIQVRRPEHGSLRVYLGDGDAENDYQYLQPADLRQVAKLFNRLATFLEANA